jgi:hypothetical protein
MAQLFPISGSKIYIGSAPIVDKDDDFVLADFAAVTWVEVKGWTASGRVGDSASLITSDQIGAGRTKKAKGTRNAGSMENTFDVVPADPGQEALIAATAVVDNYPFRIDWSSGAKRHFIAPVMSSQEQGGGANTQIAMAATLEINSNVVRS